MVLWLESQSTTTITVLVFALSYLLSAVIFVAVALFVHRHFAAEAKATTPVMLTPLSVIAGLLIAFLASRVWANVDRAHAAIAQEANAIRQCVVFAQALDEATHAALRRDLGAYLHFAVTEDWPAMAENRASLRRRPPGLTEAMQSLLAANPAGPGPQIAQERAVIAIEEALEARRARILLSQAAIGPTQWLVILLLGVLILVTIAMVHIDRRATVAANLFLFATALALCLVLLMVNDRPFAAGGITVQPDALRDIIVE